MPRVCRQGLSPWRAGRSVHDPGKMVLDLAVAIALGGDCLADVAVVRAQPEAVRRGGLGPDDQTDWSSLGPGCPEPQMAAIGGARAARTGQGVGAPLARSRRMQPGRWSIWMPRWSARIRRRKARPRPSSDGFGFHPMLAFVDHGERRYRGAAGGDAAPGARPTPTTPPIRSRCSTPLLPNCPNRCALGCWCVEIPAQGCRECVWHVHDLGLQYSVGSLRPTTCPGRVGGTDRSRRGDAPWTPTASHARAPRSPS